MSAQVETRRNAATATAIGSPDRAKVLAAPLRFAFGAAQVPVATDKLI
jgi:hypothetical protein